MNYAGGPLSIRYISQRQNISTAYLSQIFNKLKRKGLVKSIRGPGGGYLLAKQLDKVNVKDIIQALDEPFLPVFCLDERNLTRRRCLRQKSCVPRIVWKKLGEKITEILEDTTLADLCNEAKENLPSARLNHKFAFYI
jgi:Rrf2 family iron-sulfur cluster assembly transcriptional regulator